MRKLNKKGFNLTEVPQLIIVLLVVAIVLGVGATVLTNMQGSGQFTSTASAFYANSTVTADTNVAVDFTPSELVSDGQGETHLVSCSGAAVALGATTVSENFTISGCTVTFTNVEQNQTEHKINFTYTYNTYTDGYNNTREGLQGQEDLSGWQTTWVVIVAAAVILGIIYRYLFM